VANNSPSSLLRLTALVSHCNDRLLPLLLLERDNNRIIYVSVQKIKRYFKIFLEEQFGTIAIFNKCTQKNTNMESTKIFHNVIVSEFSFAGTLTFE